MTDLEKLSRIGFGTYRLENTDEGYAALVNAISKGCNTIDTAPNYALGEAEEVVGSVVRNIDRSKIFIISKVGYTQGLPTSKLDSIIPNGNYFEIGNGNYYSLDHDFIEHQLSASLHRLKTNVLDGYLIHNPEYLLDKTESVEDFYRKMRETFEILEMQVKRGRIRYFGISSRKVGLSDFEFGRPLINLNRVFSSASMASGSMRLLQMPFNILENKVIDIASVSKFTKSRKIKLFTNRPLNAFMPNGKAIRLACKEVNMVPIEEMYERLLLDIDRVLVGEGSYKLKLLESKSIEEFQALYYSFKKSVVTEKDLSHFREASIEIFRNMSRLLTLKDA